MGISVFFILIGAALKLVSPQVPELDVPTELGPEDETIRIDNREGWLYRAGDDTSRASPEASSEGWEPLQLSMPPDAFPDDWEGIGWFRTTIEIDSTLFGKKAGFYGSTFGALEVYVNGELVGRTSTPAAEAQNEEVGGFFDPIIFSWAETDRHHIAIRYSNHRNEAAWGSSDAGPILNLADAETAQAAHSADVSERRTNGYFQLMQIGFVLALALLHLILFSFYPADRANLIYGSMMLTLSVVYIGIATYFFNHEPEIYYIYVFSEGIAFTLFAFLNLTFIYYITGRKVNWLFMMYGVVGLLLLILFVMDPLANAYMTALFVLLSVGLTVYFFARDRIVENRNDFNVILAAYMVFLIMILPRILHVGLLGTPLLWSESYFVTQIGIIVLPIGYSAYLGRRFASINRDLKSKLRENEKLSTEKIKAEQEKHELINRQKEQLEQEVEKRTAELNRSLDELKSTQNQLVQQEKLASLGQLTAGIAHEIKNPLNFVNNFSDVSLEMVADARQEIRAKSDGNGEQLLGIIDDIEANLKKIHEHGSRANEIVQSMSQHIRSGSGKKEPADLNALVHEYVNLAFHGMRAGPEPINVEIKYDLDKNIQPVPLVSEDFSRVIVNLCNNAFDAMRGKLKEAKSETYQPKLTARTRQEDDHVRFEIEDNGPGVPDELRDQILQPFFTTKKGTKGTGLGLSITHDIISAHNGHLDITSKNGEGVKFFITIPSQK